MTTSTTTPDQLTLELPHLRMHALAWLQPGLIHGGAVPAQSFRDTAVWLNRVMDKEQDAFVAQAQKVLRGRIGARWVVNHHLGDCGVCIVSQQHQGELSFSKRGEYLGRQRLKHDAAINLAAEYDFFPGTTRIDWGKHQMVFVPLDRSYEAVDNERVHSFENPRIVGVQQSDAMRATARECPSAEVWTVAHFRRKRANAFCRLGASPMGSFNVATQDSGDGRARDPG